MKLPYLFIALAFSAVTAAMKPEKIIAAKDFDLAIDLVRHVISESGEDYSILNPHDSYDMAKKILAGDLLEEARRCNQPIAQCSNEEFWDSCIMSITDSNEKELELDLFYEPETKKSLCLLKENLHRHLAKIKENKNIKKKHRVSDQNFKLAYRYILENCTFGSPKIADKNSKRTIVLPKKFKSLKSNFDKARIENAEIKANKFEENASVFDIKLVYSRKAPVQKLESKDPPVKDKETGLYHCPFKGCEQTRKKPSEMTAHIRVHTGERPYKCDIDDCDRKFKMAADLNRHMETHRTERDFKCSQCSNTFTTEHYLKHHVQMVHTIKERLYICEYKNCGESFKTKAHLDTHFSRHSDEKPYECTTPGCNHRSKTNGDLTKHIKVVHAEGYQKTCKKCGHTFYKLKKFQKHMCKNYGDILRPINWAASCS